MKPRTVMIVAAAVAVAVLVPTVALVMMPDAADHDSADAQQQPTSDNIDSESKLLVLSSFYPIEQFTRAVGGDHIILQQVMPPGADPHSWEPTVRDVQQMRNADLIVINGLNYEVWTDNLREIGFNLLDSSQHIPTMNIPPGAHHHHHDHGHDEHGDEHDEHGDEHDEHGDEHDEHGDEHDEHGDEHDERHDDDKHHDEDKHYEDNENLIDPHIWLSPVLAQQQVRNIADGLVAADPSNAAHYNANADAYIQKLQQLDADFQSTLDGCRTDFVAHHLAFAYLADEYGLTQHVLVASTTPHGEIASRTLENVIESAQDQNVTTVFTEKAADPRAAQIVADEIGGDVLTLSPLEHITTDDGTYLSVMYENLDSLHAALCVD